MANALGKIDHRIAYRMATLPGTEFMFEKSILEQYPRAIIRAAEYRTDLALEVVAKAIALKHDYPRADIQVFNQPFATILRYTMEGFHSIWFDCCGPLRIARGCHGYKGSPDAFTTIEMAFQNEHLFDPAHNEGKPGQFFITVSGHRDNTKLLAQLARRHGMQWKPTCREAINLKSQRYNRFARAGALIQKIQDAAATQGWYAVPCLSVLYNSRTNNHEHPMCVVGLNVFKPESAEHRLQLEQDMEFCRGRVLEDTIDLNALPA